MSEPAPEPAAAVEPAEPAATVEEPVEEKHENGAAPPAEPIAEEKAVAPEGKPFCFVSPVKYFPMNKNM